MDCGVRIRNHVLTLPFIRNSPYSLPACGWIRVKDIAGAGVITHIAKHH
jgi:hypothetical protein